jgi:hypothetical protein
MGRENIKISFTSELPDGIPRQDARRGKTDAAFGRVRLLPVIPDGDSQARVPQPNLCGEVMGISSPMGAAGAANPGRASSGGRDPIRPNGHHVGAFAIGY